MLDRVSQHVTPYELNLCLSVLVSFSKQLDPLKKKKVVYVIHNYYWLCHLIGFKCV